MDKSDMSAGLKEFSVKELIDSGNCAVYGRTNYGLDILPLFWNHSGVELVCDGSELWVELEVDCGFFEPWIAAELNGAFMMRRMLLASDRYLCLYRSMEPHVKKTVNLYRELQAMSEDPDCHVLIKSFFTDGEFHQVRQKKHRIELVGDSITSGEGTYGATEDTEWLTMYMSSSRHYGRLLEKAFDADVRMISQGGWGVYCGWDNDIRHNIPSIYDKTCGLATGDFNEKLGSMEKYDFNSWQPEVIIVNLGTNDASAFEQPPLYIPELDITVKQRKNDDGSYYVKDAKKVEEAVVSFLKLLRKCNPDAHILWVYGMLGYGLTLTLTEGVNAYRSETGDNNVAFINLPDTSQDEYGAHMHPGYESHIKAAKVISDYLHTNLSM